MSSKPPTLAFDLDHNVRTLSAMASNLTPYLYEKELYGYLSGDLPRLTIGGLLLRLYRVSRLEAYLDAEQQNAVQDARINFEAERANWSVHYETKLQEELQARLNAFDRYLTDCRNDPGACAAGYPSQAEKRTIIEHLQTEAEEREVLSGELRARIKEIDQELLRSFHEGPFITDERLKAVYPHDRFWWLYGSIAEEGRR